MLYYTIPAKDQTPEYVAYLAAKKERQRKKLVILKAMAFIVCFALSYVVVSGIVSAIWGG